MPPLSSVKFGVLGAAVLAVPLAAQSATRLPERAVRRDIPMTNAIQRAFAAGTRDSTGRPGRNYWQLRTDYTINVRLDPSTQTLTGRETIVIHNNTRGFADDDRDAARPEHFLVQRAARRAVGAGGEDRRHGHHADGRERTAGESQSAAPAGGGGGRGGGAAAPRTENSAHGPQDRRARRSRCCTPIPAQGQATLEIEWNHKVPGRPGQSTTA